MGVVGEVGAEDQVGRHLGVDVGAQFAALAAGLDDVGDDLEGGDADGGAPAGQGPRRARRTSTRIRTPPEQAKRIGCDSTDMPGRPLKVAARVRIPLGLLETPRSEEFPYRVVPGQAHLPLPVPISRRNCR